MNKKRSRLPRGLRWKSDSPYIWFSWRDSRGKQHQQSTESNDPVKAFDFRTQFMAKRKDYEKRVECQSPEMGCHCGELRNFTSVGRQRIVLRKPLRVRRGSSKASRNSLAQDFRPMGLDFITSATTNVSAENRSVQR